MIKQLNARQRSSNKHKVYFALKNAIQFMEVKPGTQIVESELEASFGVGRTPIREALMSLADEKLIDIYPQRGTYVSKINLVLAKEMAYLRHILETDILMGLCERKADLNDAVEEKLYRMNLALNREDTLEYIRQDAEFHRTLFAFADHEKIWDVIATTRAHYVRCLVLDMKLPLSLKKSYESHRQIVNCIRLGEKEQLAEILEEHHDYKLSAADEELIRQYPDYFYR